VLQDFLDLFPFDVTSITPPVFRVFHQIARFKPGPGLDRGETPITRPRRRASRTVRSDMFVEEILLGSISGKL